ncbi:MAG: TetR/AcrR family transcriptional regulator [Spirochaetales bacterium]|jgi:AcrR family transcriptional regulator|nr:TetR/AcrR family transcriptional regulator [Spirochaetales bacterium]
MKPLNTEQFDPRVEVLKATLTLFSEKGYFRTSMQDISAEAKVSIGSIYHHFQNKEVIAQALYDMLLDRVTSNTTYYLAKEETFEAGCKGLIRHFFRATEHDPHAVKFLLYARHQEFLPDYPAICQARPFELLVEAAKKGIASGELRDIDPVILITAALGGAMRLMLRKVDGVMETPLDDYFEASWECTWRGISR